MNDELEEAEHELVVPFLTDDETWVYGFECGMLFGQMDREVTPIKNYFHQDNLKQIKVFADKLGYQIKVGKKRKDGWVKINLEKDIWAEIIE